MEFWQILLLSYLAAISLLSIAVCVYDKIAAKRNPRHRVRESTLLWMSVFGGSVAMFATMQIIRHKTKHLKFMLGIPLILVLQIALAVAAFVLLR